MNMNSRWYKLNLIDKMNEKYELGRIIFKFKNLSFLKFIKAMITPNERFLLPLNDVRNKTCQHEKVDNIFRAPKLFLLVNPFGLLHQKKINKLLKKYNICYEEIELIDYWALADEIYPSVKKIVMNAWEMVAMEKLPEEFRNNAKILIIENADEKKILWCKQKLRKILGFIILDVFYANQWHETTITPIHAPDPEEVEEHFNLCFKYVRNMTLKPSLDIEMEKDK